MDWIAFMKSIARDTSAELRKWIKGSTNLDFLKSRPCVTHIQGIAVFGVLLVILTVMFSYQASGIKVGPQQTVVENGGGGKAVDYSKGNWQAQTGSGQDSGYVNANSNAATKAQQVLDKNAVQVQFVLKWTDEPNRDRRHTNQPDELGVSVVSPWGQNQSLSAKNPIGGEGVVTITFNITQTKVNGANGTGDWNYTVFAKACGAQTPPRVGLAFTDAGNAYTLDVSWKYYTKPSK